MRRRAVVICAGLCIAAGVWYGVATRPPSVSAVLSKQMQRGPGSTVDLAEVATFAWDRVYVFGPYTPHSHIHASLGFHWPWVSGTTVEWNEAVNLVVFVRGAKVVDWFEHPRSEELEGLAGSNGYARPQARFTVCRVGAEQRLALIPQKR
jgi:hypothetical protein